MSNFSKLSDEDREKIIPERTILLGYRGSIAHGMYLNPEDPSSVDDKDIMGVCIAPPEVYFGTRRFEQREVQFEEWDSVVYEFRKFIKLLMNANPNVLGMLWLQENHYIIKGEAGKILIRNRNLFATKRAYKAFTGYAYGQLKRMTHLAFEGYMGEKRKALVKKHGYDTKNAAHLIRILRMGIEFLVEGELHVFRKDAPQLMEIKMGGWSLEKVKTEAERLFKLADEAYVRCDLPNEPDIEAIDKLCLEIMRYYWQDHFAKEGYPKR